MNVIQIGASRFIQTERLPQDVKWIFRDGMKPLFEEEEERPRSFEVVILDGPIDEENLPAIKELGSSFTYFYTDRLVRTEGIAELHLCERNWTDGILCHCRSRETKNKGSNATPYYIKRVRDNVVHS